MPHPTRPATALQGALGLALAVEGRAERRCGQAAAAGHTLGLWAQHDTRASPAKRAPRLLWSPAAPQRAFRGGHFQRSRASRASRPALSRSGTIFIAMAIPVRTSAPGDRSKHLFSMTAREHDPGTAPAIHASGRAAIPNRNPGPRPPSEARHHFGARRFLTFPREVFRRARSSSSVK